MLTDRLHVLCTDLGISSDYFHWFLGALTKFRKATIRILEVCHPGCVKIGKGT